VCEFSVNIHNVGGWTSDFRIRISKLLEMVTAGRSMSGACVMVER